MSTFEEQEEKSPLAIPSHPKEQKMRRIGYFHLLIRNAGSFWL